jgi:hypothetical protein
MSVASNHRRNYERTDETIAALDGLIDALYQCLDAVPGLTAYAPENASIWALIHILREKIEALQTARKIEWVGLGGASPSLTKKQIRAAKESQ